MNFTPRICLLGFGEVGQTFAADLLARGVTDLCAWDLLFASEDSQPTRAAQQLNIRRASDPRDAVANANLVISAVTAAQDVAAARSVMEYLSRDTYFLDVNSVSPGVKQQVNNLVGSVHARYVEAAIMSPISPRRIASPILLGGPHAREFLPIAQSLGLAGVEVFSSELGRAAAAKMCRSVMIKGMEALLAESLISARTYGVEQVVLDSLRNLFPSADWPTLARYMISRSLIHGRRRAEEMREVAQTVREAGLQPSMSAACVERQDWAAQYRDAAECEELNDMLDRLIASSIKGSNASC